MSTILAERLSGTAIIQTAGITHLPRRQTTAMTAKKSAASPWQATHESQTLRAVSLYAARLGRVLRSRSRASPVREVRRRTRRGHQALPPQGP
jgi:hypothetical protein